MMKPLPMIVGVTLSLLSLNVTYAYSSCDEIPDETKKQECKKIVEEKCAELKGQYWPHRNCVEPIANSFDICQTEEFKKAKKDANAFYYGACMEADRLDNNKPEPWLNAYSLYKKDPNAFAKYHEKYASCDRDADSYNKKCMEAGKKFTDTFEEVAKIMLDRYYNELAQIKDIVKRTSNFALFATIKVNFMFIYDKWKRLIEDYPDLASPKLEIFMDKKLEDVEKLEADLEKQKIAYYNSLSCPNPQRFNGKRDKGLEAKAKKLLNGKLKGLGKTQAVFVSANGGTNRNWQQNKDFKNYAGAYCAKATGKAAKYLKKKGYPLCYSGTITFRQEKLIGDHKWSSNYTIFSGGYDPQGSGTTPYNCKKTNK